MLDLKKQKWSSKVLSEFDLPDKIFPELIHSTTDCGTITHDFAETTGLSIDTKVFGGGSDNACGALSAGLVGDGMIVTSLGTSVVVMKKESNLNLSYSDQRQIENFIEKDDFYSMAVNLTSSIALDWFNSTFTKFSDINDLVKLAKKSSPGAKGLIFASYLMGERFPYANSNIRASFIGISDQHSIDDFARSVLEGIIFAIKDISSVYNFDEIEYIIAIGGGTQSDFWVQIQANILGKTVYASPQASPATGAAMLGAIGLEWYHSPQECSDIFNKCIKKFEPDINIHKKFTRTLSRLQKNY